MSWFKVDDGLPSSRKVLSIPRADRCAAMGLWSLGGAWCSKELTDGMLPKYMLEELCGDEALAHLLIEAGLWVEHEDGWEYHDWADYQPTSEDVKEKRRKNADRLRAWRDEKARKDAERNDVGNAVTGDVTNVATTSFVRSPPTRPDPTRPDPLVGADKSPRGTRYPDSFEVTDEMKRWAVEQGYGWVNLDGATAKFADYWQGVPGQKGVKLDWEATWRNWIRSDVERGTTSKPVSKRSKATPEGW